QRDDGLLWCPADDGFYPETNGIGDGLECLQEENPGVTAIILEFDYQYPLDPNASDPAHDPYPTVVERVGTISEKTPHVDP
ncbi:MAG: hypothetical protein ACE5IJ_03885, partial [Thermoplasmata archaeon]